MNKIPFVTKEQVEEIVKTYPTLSIFMMKRQYVKMPVSLKLRFHGIKVSVNILQ